MRLQSLLVHGYKRFAAKNVAYIRAPLVAFVGPNEAGKTSLLEAAAHLSNEIPADEDSENPTGKGRFTRREFSGRKDPEARGDDDNPIIVAARFSLEEADREHLGDLIEDDIGYVFELRKRANGQIKHIVMPRPQRKLGLRKQGITKLRHIIEKEWLSTDPEYYRDEDEEPPENLPEAPTFQRVAEQLLSELESAAENLSNQTISGLRDFARRLEGQAEHESRATVKKLPAVLVELSDAEDTQPPNDIVGQKLRRRRPVFLLFGDAERNLDSSYTWEEDPDALPALRNLLGLADLTYGELRELALDPDRKDELATVELNANAQLAQVFEAWHQSKLAVSLGADPEGLTFHMRDRVSNEHTRLEERSSGLRSFVALIAFCTTHARGQTAILLVDEAENHLHYEAQADLLRVFERQSAAQTVVYTTHSIGCLPEDLGSAIRVVAPDGATSSVLNSFWSGNAVGLTPMMLAMGANALAFTPARYAVIGEGRSDAILIPTLLREAREGDPYDRLGFQVVPGVAEVHSDDAADLEHEAGNVVYLVDSDDGGLAHANALSEKAQQEGRVVELGDGKVPGLCLEDLVRGKLLVEAFNRVLSRTRPEYEDDPLQESNLPTLERSLFLENWCKERSVHPLSKPYIAQETVDIGRERNEPLLRDEYRQLTHNLYVRLRDALGLKDENEDLV